MIKAMNKRGQKSVFGFAFIILGFMFIISAFALIPIFVETLNNARDNTELNCPGTLGYNATDYDDDTSFEKLVRRPTCFVTGFSMVYFIGSFIIAVFVWVLANWRKIGK